MHYSRVNATRWCCRSYTTRISEVEDAGKPSERFHERDGAVYLECRAISLTRDVPTGLGWIIEPIIRKLPRETLVNTLESTRRGLRAEAAG